MRELAALAHEEELRQALIPLAEAFEQWRAGRVESGELVDAIHRFHNGAAREIWKRYAYDLDFGVARAIATGIIPRDKVPPDVLAHLSRMIEHFTPEPAAPRATPPRP